MIVHVLKDGTEITDITGHLVKHEEMKKFYNIISKDKEKNKNENHRKLQSTVR